MKYTLKVYKFSEYLQMAFCIGILAIGLYTNSLFILLFGWSFLFLKLLSIFLYSKKIIDLLDSLATLLIIASLFLDRYLFKDIDLVRNTAIFVMAWWFFISKYISRKFGLDRKINTKQTQVKTYSND